MVHHKKIVLLTVLCMSVCSVLTASDADAAAYLESAAKKKEAEKYAAAGKAYQDAAHMADSAAIKANALIQAVICFRNAKLYGKEFDCLEKLLNDHISHVDFKRAVSRQFEIGDDFFAGHRDTVVSWLPFIKDADKTVEIYEAALKHASCAAESPDARHRLGTIYLENGKADQAIRLFRENVSLHPETEAARYSRLELINAYMDMAKSGDGDGAWTRLAMESLNEFIKTYPEDREIPWAKQSLDKIRALHAERLYGIAKYYHRIGRNDLAERYLARVIQEHGTSEHSEKSEKLLAEIDSKYTPPPADAPREKAYQHEFERNTIPREHSPVMIIPENSDGKWLLPIRNLKNDTIQDSRDPVPERKVNKNEF